VTVCPELGRVSVMGFLWLLTSRASVIDHR
jgi:hypothetical protein